MPKAVARADSPIGDVTSEDEPRFAQERKKSPLQYLANLIWWLFFSTSKSGKICMYKEDTLRRTRKVEILHTASKHEFVLPEVPSPGG